MGILVSLFIGMFALDAFSPGKRFPDALLEFLIHLLPALLLLTLVALSWRREWIGALAFIGLAILYTITMSKGRIDWVLVIAGPLFLVGLLFMWIWLRRKAGSV
jgi:hypothetical protein